MQAEKPKSQSEGAVAEFRDYWIGGQTVRDLPEAVATEYVALVRTAAVDGDDLAAYQARQIHGRAAEDIQEARNIHSQLIRHPDIPEVVKQRQLLEAAERRIKQIDLEISALQDERAALSRDADRLRRSDPRIGSPYSWRASIRKRVQMSPIIRTVLADELAAAGV